MMKRSSGEDISAALQALQEENQRLKRAVEELSVLNEIARSISGSRRSEHVINGIVKHSMRSVSAEQVVISLVKEKSVDELKTLVRVKRTSGKHAFHLTDSLLAWMSHNKSPLLTNKPTEDQRLRGVWWEQELDSLLCVPLVVRGKLIGILAACNKRGGGGFTEEDQRLLAIIAAQSGQVIENTRLAEEEEAYAIMQEQVRLAGEIQLGLLPDAAPQIAGYDLAGMSLPTESVGGDYFDFIPLENDRLVLCLGDVSGKGIPASLLMANLQATLRGQVDFNTFSHECVIWSNRLLYRSTAPEKFATLFYGVLDTREHTLDYCNAGHERPMVFSPGSDKEMPYRLAKGGLVLGMLDEFAYQSETIPLHVGDLLVIFSDGVTDAENTAGEPYGEDRLKEVLNDLLHESAETIVERITKSVQEHSQDVPQVDDITLVVVRRLE